MKKLLCSLFVLSAVSTAMAQEVKIKLLGTSDIHGRVVPVSYTHLVKSTENAKTVFKDWI